jgi:4-amino-4-deoxy-L-arabinose transferase-like glycosyltransferase
MFVPQPLRLSRLARLVNAWFRNEDRAVRILLALFVVAWTTFYVVSYTGVGLHSDNLEMYAWAQHPRLGYAPHPPLGALMVAAWFAVFPATEWSFYLLAMVNSAVALYAVDRIARRYLLGDKRLLVLLLLLLLPFYQFRGQRFSVNLTLLSTWPIATYCFLRAFETRAVVWAVAVGATAALAMLGKYYSIYLVAAFVIAALAHPERWVYLKSSSPWISISVGLCVLAPHIYWLATTGFQPFDYALRTHAGVSRIAAFDKAGSYAVGGVASVALMVGVFWLATRTTLRALANSLWPSEPRLSMLAILFWVPLVLPMLTAPFFGAVLIPLWVMQGCFLLPILLLASPGVALRRRHAVQVGSFVLLTTAALLIAAPAVPLIRGGQSGILPFDDRNSRVYGKAIAQRVTELWHQITGRPLTIVAGGWDPVPYVVTFYSADHPDSIVSRAPGRPDGPITYDLDQSPWITRDRLAREGWLAVCALQAQHCIDAAYDLAAGGSQPRRIEFDAVVTILGWSPPPVRYVAILVPPQAAAEN